MWSICFCTACWLVNLAVVLSLLGSTTQAETRIGLAEAIERAIDYSYTIKAAEYDSVAAFRQHRVARASRLPTFSADVTSFYIDETQLLNLPMGQTVEVGAKENYQADLKLSLPMFTGGSISGAIHQSKANVLAAASALDSRRLAVSRRTRQAYLQLILSEHLLKSAEASLRRVEVIAQDITNRHVAGLADSLGILEAKLAHEHALQAVQTQETRCENARIVLARLLGLDMDDDIIATDSLKPIVSLQSCCPAPETSSLDRPEIAYINHQITAAKAATDIIGARAWPSLAGHVGYSVGKPNRDFFNKTWNDYFSVGARLKWNFNLGGRPIRERAAAIERVRSLRMQRREMTQTLTQEAYIAYNKAQEALTTAQSRQRELTLARDRYRLGQQQQQAGRLTVNRLVELEEELTAAEQMFRAAQADVHLAITEYWYALGSRQIYGGL